MTDGFLNNFRPLTFEYDDLTLTSKVYKSNGVHAGTITVKIAVLKGDKLADDLKSMYGRNQ